MQSKGWRRLLGVRNPRALAVPPEHPLRPTSGSGRPKFAPAVLVLSLCAAPACAVELPPPEILEAQTGLQGRPVTVVEPHESGGPQTVTVAYKVFPIRPLLDRWFGAGWKAPDAELEFLAADGYRSLIGSSRLQSYPAYLAYARADGVPFVVDSRAQHQTRVPLGPYYLIWDNQTHPELLQQGTVGWPYQVTRIELRTRSDDAALIPPNASAEVKAGYLTTKDHCLTCHKIRGVGGEKVPVDLAQAVCGWNDDGLRSLIGDPARLRPGTAMPAFDADGDSGERQRSIDRIVAYLNAIKAADASCSEKSSER